MSKQSCKINQSTQNSGKSSNLLSNLILKFLQNLLPSNEINQINNILERSDRLITKVNQVKDELLRTFMLANFIISEIKGKMYEIEEDLWFQISVYA